MPGLQEAAAERFDRLLETGEPETENRDNVGKMLAGHHEIASEPFKIKARTFEKTFALVY